jgi:hypothetical protein
MMRTDNSVLEQELRELYAEVPAPPAPAAWGPAPARTDLRPRIVRRLALVAAAAVVVSAAFVMVQVRRTANAPVLTVSALPAASDLTCSLPIAALSADQTTGFVVFQHGHATLRVAPAGGTTYDPALGGWVNVLPQLVAPDGRSYVEQGSSGGHSNPQTIVRVVDASGARTVLTTATPFNVFAFTAQGILLDDMTPGPNGPDGSLKLEVLDPATGAVRPFPFPPPQPGIVHEAGGGTSAGYRREDNAIWMTAYSPSADRTVVRRYDLATGATTEWFDGQTDGKGHVEVVGTDGHGKPIVQLASRDLFHTNPAQREGIVQRTILLTAPHQETALNEGRVGDPGVAGNLGPLTVNDGDRVWLAADDGTIWMYLPGSGLLQMAKVVKTSTSGPPGVIVSGPCR